MLHKIHCLTLNSLILWCMRAAYVGCRARKRCFNGSQLKLIYLSHLLEIQIYAYFILPLIEKLMRSHSYTCHHAKKHEKA